MHAINELLQNNELSLNTTLLRLGFAFLAGAIIGLERETNRQPAGLKTHILICVGSTLIMLLSVYIPQTYGKFGNADPGRIAAQVISGIGFIGAGAILRMGINVRGLTTASSIWAIAAIGLAIGAGMYLAATITIVLILFVLIIVEQLERHFFTPLNIKILTINTESSSTDEIIKAFLHKKHIRLIDVNTAFSKKKQYTITYKIGSSNNNKWVELTGELIDLDQNINEAKFQDPKA